MMNEKRIICKSEDKAQGESGKLERAEFKRIENCYWIEIWKRGSEVYIIERDF